jgi:hypothetical protein
MGDEHVELFEAARVQYFFDPFPGGILSLFVLAGGAFFSPAQAGFFLARRQVKHFFFKPHRASI